MDGPRPNRIGRTRADDFRRCPVNGRFHDQRARMRGFGGVSSALLQALEVRAAERGSDRCNPTSTETARRSFPLMRGAAAAARGRFDDTDRGRSRDDRARGLWPNKPDGAPIAPRDLFGFVPSADGRNAEGNNSRGSGRRYASEAQPVTIH